MITRIGTGFDGSGDWMTTNASNTDILSGKNKRYCRFCFNNNSDCHIKVNGIRIFIKAGQGFNTNYTDPVINSFVIEENGTQYNWAGAYM